MSHSHRYKPFVGPELLQYLAEERNHADRPTGFCYSYLETEGDTSTAMHGYSKQGGGGKWARSMRKNE